MCMNTPVYSTNTKQVLRTDLMPCPKEHFSDWRDSRLFLRGINRIPEEDERILGADSLTVKRRLSLSDSYWFKYSEDKVDSFDQVTPYLNEFTEYGICLSDKSSPSITVTGTVSKMWKRLEGNTALYKVMMPAWVKAETAAVGLAMKLNLPVNNVTILSNAELLIHNFTEPGKMLMRLQPWDLGIRSTDDISSSFGYDILAVDKAYRDLGIENDFHITTLLFDVIVTNYDRLTNLSNWGYFKDGKTGKNTSAPLYDFNLAHPDQKNQYLHIIKPQLIAKHKILLRSWRNTIASYGYPAWTENVDELLR